LTQIKGKGEKVSFAGQMEEENNPGEVILALKWQFIFKKVTNFNFVF
jgi:hypothetical protein